MCTEEGGGGFGFCVGVPKHNLRHTGKPRAKGTGETIKTESREEQGRLSGVGHTGRERGKKGITISTRNNTADRLRHESFIR